MPEVWSLESGEFEDHEGEEGLSCEGTIEDCSDEDDEEDDDTPKISQKTEIFEG